MDNSRLQEELLRGFHEDRKLLRKQLELFDPLAVSLRQPAAKRLLGKGLLLFCEFGCYLMMLLAAGSVFFLDRLYPFYLLNMMRSRREFTEHTGIPDMENLHLAVAGLFLLIALLFLVMARVVRRVRLKNDILHMAGRHIKTLVGQHLERKAALDAIEQRYFFELPGLQQGPDTVGSMPKGDERFPEG